MDIGSPIFEKKFIKNIIKVSLDSKIHIDCLQYEKTEKISIYIVDCFI